MIRNICVVSREYDGVAGAGGLKDVVRALALEQAYAGYQVTVILPRYGFMSEGEILHEFPLDCRAGGTPVLVRRLETVPVEIITIDHPIFSEKKDIYTYNEEDSPENCMPGNGHNDVNLMNCAFQEAAVRYMMCRGEAPDIVHGHDGHSGLLGAYMLHLGSGFFSRTGLLTTIHNAGIAYQQNPGSLEETSRMTGLPESILKPGAIGNEVVPFLLAGEQGMLNTVSPGYARELLSGQEPYSGQLGSVLSDRNIPVKGIINGLDAGNWLEKSDIPRDGIPFSRKNIRVAISAELQSGELSGITCHGNLPDPESRWLLFHGRLTEQKGVDEIISLVSGPLNGRKGYHIIVYGQGEAVLEQNALRAASEMKNWTFLRGYNESITARLISASSWMMIPSRWEPCGQIDMIGQLLGALPIVKGVGGLLKIRNRIDGLSYSPEEYRGLEEKIMKALKWEDNRPRKVRRMRERAENTIYERRSWREVLVRGYLPIYRKALHKAIHRPTI